MLQNTIGRLRLIGLLEGASFLVLVGIAMPLKYWADKPEAVQIFGMAHGVLFVVFLLVLLQTMIECRWTMGRGAKIFFAALVPFGPFMIDKWLKGLDLELRERQANSPDES